MSFASSPRTTFANDPAPHPAVYSGQTPLAVDVLPEIRAYRGELTVSLPLRHAGARVVTLRYEGLGGAGLPAVFVAGGISAHRHVGSSAAFTEAGWWEAQVGSGRALDPTRHRIVAFDWLGSDGSLDAVIDPADQADAVAAVLDALDIERVHAFIGCSYGAMVGLQFAARHGGRLDRLVAISGAHRAHPFSSAWRALQRRAVALGALQCDETHGLALARQLAILSYRTPEEFADRFEAAQVVDGRVRVAAEDYLDHCGALYTTRTSPVAFQRLSESIDLQALEPARIDTPTTVVAVEQDRLVPVEDSLALAQGLRGATRVEVLSSRYGHDAFLKEEAAIAAVLTQALQEAATSHTPIAIEAAA
ncbi:homoserine O-succinyltransferase MetX [Lysobacter solisilvae (ex Woo and Kim 2020)]|uniref:Homoserine O-succinyltransferase n=1 Tax=Agrilutibacter terrestris TaxID=2865112 RepID=A0A7H0FYU7_9GAMM|nr:homoserine O-succinyltransferase [Lysobacter terrestris]QNP41213.1 homoserine O-succinyltransferase [Lysobacter terrestris]